jgi:two-component system, cell cycle response regulator DivK
MRAPLVLLVDDNQDARRCYRASLIQRGYRVATAHNGVAGVRTALRRRPDVIVMDLLMPDLDGIEATRQLREDERTREIPVVAVTGYGWKTVARVAAQAGFVAFLTKPCAGIELVTTLDQVLHAQ